MLGPAIRSTHNDKRIPSPCTDAFKEPVYQVHDFSYEKLWGIESQKPNISGRATFTLTDLANQYSVLCTNPNITTPSDWYRTDDDHWWWCSAAGADPGQKIQFRYRYSVVENSLAIYNDWTCLQANGSYP